MSFRYPVGNGTREDFEKRFYVAFGYGEKTTYGYHEGADINLKTGGDSDLGEPLYAISDWKLKYYHLKSHLESGFGEHFVYEVNSPWGKKWIHYAHNQKTIDPNKKSEGKIGDKLAEIDKTGRPRLSLPAHCHLAVFKVDPISLPQGIDTIAKTKAQLNDWWEDPIELFKNWNDYKEEDMNIEELIIQIRKGLLNSAPSQDELKWDVDNWTNVEDFIRRITGDAKFYALYVQPQLDSQKIVLQNDCSKEKSEITSNWQSMLESAKKEYEDKLSRQIEDKNWKELIVLGLNKLFRG